jgi:large subunit ribosomal protein L7/L12
MSNLKTIEQLVHDLSALTILDAAELVSALENKWGVSAAAPVAMAASAGAAPAANTEDEQTEFNVILLESGDKKIDVIKELRGITGLSLAEAKAMAETAGVAVKEALSKKDAEDVKKKLEAVGAKVKLV